MRPQIFELLVAWEASQGLRDQQKDGKFSKTGNMDASENLIVNADICYRGQILLKLGIS